LISLLIFVGLSPKYECPGPQLLLWWGPALAILLADYRCTLADVITAYGIRQRSGSLTNDSFHYMLIVLLSD